MTLQNNCSDINFKIIEYLDVMNLTAFSTSCKSMNKDSTLYLNKFKKTNMSNYIDKHTCRNCLFCSNEVEKNFCNDCFLYKCDNCFGVKNEMTEFVKYVNVNNEGLNEIKLMCHDYCMYRCHKCKYCDVSHQLFFNDNDKLQTICVDCYVELNDEEKNKYNKVHNNDEWDDLDALD
jgi:hypothetical protein